MSTSRFQWIQSNLSYINHATTDCFSGAKSWCTQTWDSPPVLLARGTARGAMKAALGVYYIFDLGLSILPATSPWYVGFNAVKYITTTVAFGLSAYNTYQSICLENAYPLNQKKFMRKLNQAKQLTKAGQKIEEETHKLVSLEGYPSSRRTDIPEILTDEINTAASEQKVFHYIQAATHGAVTATGIYYFLREIFSLSPGYTSMRILSLGCILVISALGEYDKLRLNALTNDRLVTLENDFLQQDRFLLDIQEKTGTLETLTRVIQQSRLENDYLSTVIEKSPPKAVQKSYLTQIAASGSGIFFRSAINGCLLYTSPSPRDS